jgi:hypothetical protein
MHTEYGIYGDIFIEEIEQAVDECIRCIVQTIRVIADDLAPWMHDYFLGNSSLWDNMDCDALLS